MMKKLDPATAFPYPLLIRNKKLGFSMLLGNKVSIFAGTGYIGREVTNELSKSGYKITFLVRHPERYRDFALYPNTVIKTLTSYDDANQLNAAVEDADIVINLTTDRSNGTEMIEYADLVHVNQKLKLAIKSAGVKRILSLSHIGSSAEQPISEWNGALAEIDTLMHSIVNAHVTIFKPSLLIGENDETTARFIKQLERMPLLMVAQSSTVVQPLWVRDFAQAIVSTIRNPVTFGQKMDVAGEARMTLKMLASLVAKIRQQDAIIFPMCRLNAIIMSKLGGLAPIASVSASQLVMLKNDLISESNFLSSFGFVPSSLEWVISTYATPHRIRERYNYYRKEVGRSPEKLD